MDCRGRHRRRMDDLQSASECRRLLILSGPPWRPADIMAIIPSQGTSFRSTESQPRGMGVPQTWPVGIAAVRTRRQPVSHSDCPYVVDGIGSRSCGRHPPTRAPYPSCRDRRPGSEARRTRNRCRTGGDSWLSPRPPRTRHGAAARYGAPRAASGMYPGANGHPMT